MLFEFIFWDLDEDSEGNVFHCAQHGVTKEEVEEVFLNALDVVMSRSTGRPAVFGETKTGRHLMVVFEAIDKNTVYPITALEVPRRQE